MSRAKSNGAAVKPPSPASQITPIARQFLMNSEPKAYARYGFNSSSRESNAKDPVTDQPNISPSPCPLPKEREKQRPLCIEPDCSKRGLHAPSPLRERVGVRVETPVLQNKLLLLLLGRQTGGEGDDGPGGAPVGGGFLDGLFLFRLGAAYGPGAVLGLGA